MELWRSASKGPHLDRLKAIWLFSDCSKQQLRLVDGLCTRADVPEGKCLTRQGEHSGQFFVIAHGIAVATIDRRPFALIEPGSFFGDMALFGFGVYRATVTSATHMEVLAFSRLECMQLTTAAIPSVEEKIDAILAERRHALAEVEVPVPVPSMVDEVGVLASLQRT